MEGGYEQVAGYAILVVWYKEAGVVKRLSRVPRMKVERRARRFVVEDIEVIGSSGRLGRGLYRFLVERLPASAVVAGTGKRKPAAVVAADRASLIQLMIKGEIEMAIDDGSDEGLSRQVDQALEVSESESEYAGHVILMREMLKVDIMRLYLKGVAMEDAVEEIRKRRGIALRPQEGYGILNAALDDLKMAYVREAEEWRVMELRRIAALEAEYWRMWEQTVAGEASTEESDVVGDRKLSTRRRDMKVALEYLKGVERCIQRRCQILGLDAPHKFQISWEEEAARAGYDPQALVNEIMRYMLEQSKSRLKEGEQLLNLEEADG